MTGQALVCELGEHTPIDGADFIVRCDMFGETVVTSKNNAPGTVGLLFDCETQISEEFLSDHNLFRDSKSNKDKTKKGFFRDRRVRCERFKGVKSTAFFMPLEDIVWDTSGLKSGMQIERLDNKDLCKKFIRKFNTTNQTRRQIVREQVINFCEHFDTDHLERNWPAVTCSPVVITTKTHGTSCRAGYLPVIKTKWWHKLLGIQNKKYQYVVGSRRVLKSIDFKTKSGANHYYASDIWTVAAREYFADKLMPGETVYFEIVGNMPSGGPIMPGHKTSKLKKFLDKNEYKRWQDHYGPDLSFNYGCGPKEFRVFVYRITLCCEDSDPLDLSWDQVKQRCQELNVPHAPEIDRLYPSGTEEQRDYQKRIADRVNEIKSNFCENFPHTPFEGVCVRVENGNRVPKILKSKTYEFKALEGIIKEESSVEDIEESN